MIVWEFAWVESALFVLEGWSSYRGGCLNRFDKTVVLEVSVLLFYSNSLKIYCVI